jgi:hypothetical protein
MRNAARHLTLGTLLTAIIWSPSLQLIAHGQASTGAPSAAAPGRSDQDLKGAWTAAVASGLPDFVSALKGTPGCLGVEAARTQSGKNVVFAWFENKQAVLNWYYSDVHQQLIKGFSNGHRRPGGPLADVPAEGPVLAIASITIPTAPANGDLRAATVQIAIELYTPLPGGIAAGGRFAPSAVKVPGLIEVPRTNSGGHN